MLWLQPLRTAKIASPMVPFSGQRDRRAAREAAIGLHLADLGFDGRPASGLVPQIGRQAAPCAADQDAGVQGSVAATTAVDHRQRRALAGQDFHLFQRLGQGVPSQGLPGKARMPTTKPLSSVVPMLTLVPNS